MSNAQVKILDGNTFVVSGTNGDIQAGGTDPSGMFSYDTRFLSDWVLTVNGQRLTTLSVDDVHYFESRHFLVPDTGTVYTDSKIAVVRERTVCEGFHEVLTVMNHDEDPVDLTIRLEAGSDFADIFEVKDALSSKGKYYTHAEQGRLVLGYQRDNYHRLTEIMASGPAQYDRQGLTFNAHIEPDGEWRTEVQVDAEIRGRGGKVVHVGHAWGSA
jgi:glycogen debranching enzyme